VGIKVTVAHWSRNGLVWMWLQL